MFCVDGFSHCPCFDNCADFCYLGQKMVSLYQDHWQNATNPLPNLPKPSLANQKNIFGENLLWGHEGKTFPIFWVGGATRKKPHVNTTILFSPHVTLQSFFRVFVAFSAVFTIFCCSRRKKEKFFWFFHAGGAAQAAQVPRRLHAGHAGCTQATQVARRCHARRFHAGHARRFHAGHAGSTQVPRKPRRFHAGHACSTQARQVPRTQVPRRPHKSRRFHATSLKFSQKITNFTFCDLQGCSDTFGFSTIFCRSDRAVQHKPIFFRPNNSNVPVWWKFFWCFLGLHRRLEPTSLKCFN